MTVRAGEQSDWAWQSAVSRPSDAVASLILDEGAILDENERLRAVLGHCPKCIAVVDEDGCVVGYNREFASLFSSAPVLGTRIGSLFESTDEAMFEDVVRAASAGNRAAALVQLRLDDAEERLVEFIIATLPARDGSIVGVILAGEDRTSTSRADRECANALRSVEELNCLAALEVGRSLLGHELATHLTAIGLAVEALARESSDRPKWAQQAKESLQQALALLARTRQSSPARHVAEPASELRLAADEAIRAVTGALRFGTLSKFRNTVPTGLELRLAPRELAQILVNLLTNAARAVEGRGRQGAVAIFAEERAPDMIDIYMRDNGEGIEPGNLGEVFDAGVTTRPEPLGRGLGLAMVKAIVEQAGGTIRIFSEPGAGTEVVVSLARAASRTLRTVAHA